MAAHPRPLMCATERLRISPVLFGTRFSKMAPLPGYKTQFT
jgi:hypothetical protein